MGDLIAHVSDRPGLTLDELTDDVHRVEPWTDQAKAAARHRLQVSLNVLRRREPKAVQRRVRLPGAPALPSRGGREAADRVDAVGPEEIPLYTLRGGA
jgi:hypothetical protein